MKSNQKLLRLWLILALTSLFQYSGFSQKAKQYWTTPIENVEFTDSLIVVTYSSEVSQHTYNIMPVHYDITLINFRSETGTGFYEYNEYRSYKKQLNDYVTDWEIGQAGDRDKQMFLETSVLLILQNAGRNIPLPENTLEILEYLEQDVVRKVARNARLVKALYDSYYQE